MEASGHDLDELGRLVTARRESVFEPAMVALQEQVAEQYRGARVLVTGGAGFIGGQTLRLLLGLEPASVVVADVWENGLAELVRDLRSEGVVAPGTRFEPRLLDVTGPLVERVVREEGPFDVVLAFAAAKHVRTERDAVSALHMVNVNVNGTLRALRAAAEANPDCRLFMVSTDKAADPSSLMGASKRLMEQVVLEAFPHATTTRFANVAFSSGSLLESWLIRLARGQTLPVPGGTTRFFVRALEAGQLCLLASAASPGAVVVPAEGTVEAVDLREALGRLLDGLGVAWDEVSAADAVGRRPGGRARVLVTERDTAGEKAAEEFVGRGESRAAWLPAVDRVLTTTPDGSAADAARWVEAALAADPGPSLDEVLSRVSAAVPEFTHVTSERRLDDRI